MAQGEIKTAVLIGAGNLGWHLGQTLHEKGIRILQVLSRSGLSCKELAVLLHTDYSTRPEQIKSTAGIIIIAVPDNQIEKVIGHGCL
jgi:predicted dinucleotide-binding enzyme